MIRLIVELNKVTYHKFPTEPPSLISSPFQKKLLNSLSLSSLFSLFLYNRRMIDVLLYHDSNTSCGLIIGYGLFMSCKFRFDLDPRLIMTSNFMSLRFFTLGSSSLWGNDITIFASLNKHLLPLKRS